MGKKKHHGKASSDPNLVACFFGDQSREVKLPCEDEPVMVHRPTRAAVSQSSLTSPSPVALTGEKLEALVSQPLPVKPTGAWIRRRQEDADSSVAVDAPDLPSATAPSGHDMKVTRIASRAAQTSAPAPVDGATSISRGEPQETSEPVIFRIARRPINPENVTPTVKSPTAADFSMQERQAKENYARRKAEIFRHGSS